jgi:hypothetical protein
MKITTKEIAMRSINFLALMFLATLLFAGGDAVAADDLVEGAEQTVPMKEAVAPEKAAKTAVKQAAQAQLALLHQMKFGQGILIIAQITDPKGAKTTMLEIQAPQGTNLATFEVKRVIKMTDQDVRVRLKNNQKLSAKASGEYEILTWLDDRMFKKETFFLFTGKNPYRLLNSRNDLVKKTDADTYSSIQELVFSYGPTASLADYRINFRRTMPDKSKLFVQVSAAAQSMTLVDAQGKQIFADKKIQVGEARQNERSGRVRWFNFTDEAGKNFRTDLTGNKVRINPLKAA